jgi:hypothetical protein
MSTLRGDFSGFCPGKVGSEYSKYNNNNHNNQHIYTEEEGEESENKQGKGKRLSNGEKNDCIRNNNNTLNKDPIHVEADPQIYYPGFRIVSTPALSSKSSQSNTHHSLSDSSS